MAVSYGWAGQIAFVNLTTGIISTTPTSNYVPQFIGGRGVATKIAWDTLAGGTGPFDAANPIMFMNGPMSGTLAPTSGRGIVASVSPRVYPNPWFCTSNMGGDWAAEMKYAGFDGIVVTGISPTHVYLYVHDGQIQIMSATSQWGMDTIATQVSLKTALGDQNVQVICIGPAGENKVYWSTIQHRQSNAAGQAGFGAVMGAKGLKAIAIRGHGGVNIANPAGFISACKSVSDLVRWGMTSGKTGSLPGTGSLPCSHSCSLGCASLSMNTPTVLNVGTGTIKAMVHCVDGDYQSGDSRTLYPGNTIAAQYTAMHGDIYTDTTSGFGTNPGNELQYMTQGLGLSGWAYETLCSFFHACIDNNLPVLAGYTLTPNTSTFWSTLLTQVSTRTAGLPNILADDLMRAVDTLSAPPGYLPDILKRIAQFEEPGWGFPAHREGRALETQPIPVWIYTMLQWITSDRDPLACHHQSSFVQSFLPSIANGSGSTPTIPSKVVATMEQGVGTGAGNGVTADLTNLDAKAQIAIWLDNRAMLKDSLLLCDWAFPRLYGPFPSAADFNAATTYLGNVDAEAQMYAPLTGLNVTTAALHTSAEAIRNLTRALMWRNYGRGRVLDTFMEPHFEYPEKTDGTYLDLDTYNAILDTYYTQRGWDKATGNPTRTKLTALGLSAVADGLAAAGITVPP